MIPDNQKHGCRGLFWPIWWLIWCLCEEWFWHKWARYCCASAFRSSKTNDYCFRIEMRWLSMYPIPCVKHARINCWQTLTNMSSSGRSIWCLAGDIFLVQSARMQIYGEYPETHKPWLCQSNDNRKFEDLYNTPWALTYIKSMAIGTYFGHFDNWSGASVRGNFGANGLDTIVLLPSKALKYITIALKYELEG